MVCRGFSPVSFWDQWEYVDIAQHAGTLPSLSRLWSQFGESRLFIGRIAGFVDVRWFGGRNLSLAVELILVPVCMAAILIGLTFLLARLNHAAKITAVSFIVFCLLSPSQVDDLTWYFEIGFVLTGLAAVVSFAALALHAARYEPRSSAWFSPPLAISVIAALFAECCRIDGLLAWPVLLALSFALRCSVRTRWFVAITGALCASLYFLNYRIQPDMSGGPWESIKHPWSTLGYVATYFATTWNGLFPAGSFWHIVTVVFTMCAVVLAGAVVIRHFLFAPLTVDLFGTFLAAVLFFTLAAACMTSFGRLNLGASQAAVNRYQCVALLFWAAIGIYALRWLAGTEARWGVVLWQLAVLILMAANLGQYPAYERMAVGRSNRLAGAYLAIVENPSDAAAAVKLNPAVSLMPGWYGYLRSRGLGPDPIALSRQLSKIDRPVAIANWGGYTQVPPERCIGRLDGFQPGTARNGIGMITGWAWDRRSMAPPLRILFSTPNGVIEGSAEFQVQREDVPPVVKEVTDINTGFEGVALAQPGTKLRAFALLRDKVSICPLPNEITVP